MGVYPSMPAHPRGAPAQRVAILRPPVLTLRLLAIAVAAQDKRLLDYVFGLDAAESDVLVLHPRGEELRTNPELAAIAPQLRETASIDPALKEKLRKTILQQFREAHEG